MIWQFVWYRTTTILILIPSHQQVTYRITDWRSYIGTEGVNAVVRMLNDHGDVLATPEDVKALVQYGLEDGHEAVPFH